MKQLRYKHVDRYSRWEEHVKNYINELPQGNFFDLGACLGAFTLHAAKQGLNVYAFEVDDINHRGLIENVKANPELEPRIKVFNIGIADTGPREVDLLFDNVVMGDHHRSLDLPNFTGDLTLLRGPRYKKRKVIVNSLDNIISEYSLPQPDYLKVDIDGSEYAFIQGAPQALQHAKSLIIEMYKGNPIYQQTHTQLTNAGFILSDEYPITQPGIQNYYNSVYRRV